MKASFVVVAIAMVLVGPAAYAQDEEPKTIYKDSHGNPLDDWTQYLVDDAAGSVSAASLLGISGEAVAPVENVRDLVASLKGLSSEGDNATLALSVTPGRTELAPVDHRWYYDSNWARLLANITIGYAQGDADIGGTAFERRATSIETGFIVDKKEDPVIMLGDTLAAAKGKCDLDDPEKNPDVVLARKTERDKLKAARKAAGSDANEGVDNTPEEVATLESDDIAKAEEAAINECFDEALKKLRWNATRFSLMYGTGWIKPKSGGDQETLGHTGVLSFTYGFEQKVFGEWLKKSLAATVIYRYTSDEPILETLETAAVRKKDSSLVVGRLAGGTEKIRGLIEVSDARSDDITASQRAFKQAVGLDVRVYDATWINLRFGRQRTIDGTENEIGSLLTISYSPSALLD